MGAKILIADDEPSIVLCLEFLMRQSGYEVRMANDGEAALQQAADFAPDLILLDIMLPRLSGIEVCRALRGAPATRAIKIVMLTAQGQATGVRDLPAVDAYITKPFGTRELLAEVRRLLGVRAQE